MSCAKCDGPLQAPPGEGPIKMGLYQWWCWRCFQESLSPVLSCERRPSRESAGAVEGETRLQCIDGDGPCDPNDSAKDCSGCGG